jgi:hypothetical protein
MAELRKLFEKKLGYDGPFRIDEMYSVIRRFLKERGYFLIETNNQEDVLAQGRQVFVEITAEEQISDYAKGQIILEIFLKEVKDKLLSVEGHKQKYQTGKVEIRFIAQLRADYRGKWENTGFKFFFRTLMDKFVRKDITSRLMEKTKKDCDDLALEVKGYLNMHRYKFAG